VKLSKVFQSKASAFREAVQTNNIPQMQKLMGKKSSFMIYEFFKDETFKDMTPEMATCFVDALDGPVVKRWSMDTQSAPAIPLGLLISHAVTQGRTDLMDVYMNPKIDLAPDNVTELVVSEIAANTTLAPETRYGYVRQIVANNIDNIKNTDKLVQDAIENNDLTVLDILANAGVDLREKNERWLREAAKLEKQTVCQHLLDRHGADLDVALTTARTMGMHSVSLFLSGLQPEPKSDDAATPTVESLSAETKELRATVKELTALVRELRTGPEQMDKPTLRPKGNTP
jgi:hypothetical protein